MKIIDINEREREVENVKLVDRDAQAWVQVLIARNNGTSYLEWYPVDDFKAKNPDVIIQGEEKSK